MQYKDRVGNEILVGDMVVRTILVGSTKIPHMVFAKVRQADEKGLYLNDSHRAIQHPNRLLVICPELVEWAESKKPLSHLAIENL